MAGGRPVDPAVLLLNASRRPGVSCAPKRADPCQKNDSGIGESQGVRFCDRLFVRDWFPDLMDPAASVWSSSTLADRTRVR
jgi:hypothetical protein